MEKLIRKHLGANTPQWVIENCKGLLLEYNNNNNNNNNKNRVNYDDKIDEWHNSDSPLTLCEYLGLTPEEFANYLRS